MEKKRFVCYQLIPTFCLVASVSTPIRLVLAAASIGILRHQEPFKIFRRLQLHKNRMSSILEMQGIV